MFCYQSSIFEPTEIVTPEYFRNIFNAPQTRWLVEKHRQLQQDITTYENNIGFFSASKNSEPLIKQMQERIEQAKVELKELEQKIRQIEESAE